MIRAVTHPKAVLLIAAVLVSVPTALSASSGAVWEEKINRNGILVWTRPVDGYPVDSYRARADINVSIEELFEFLTDLSALPDNVQGFQEMEVLRQEDNIKEYYIVVGAPMARDRDNVLRMVTQSPDIDGIARIEQRAIDTSRPERRRTVRVTNYHESWELIKLSDNRTRATLEVRFDPGGNLPDSVLNWLLAQGPYETFDSLKARFEG